MHGQNTLTGKIRLTKNKRTLCNYKFEEIKHSMQDTLMYNFKDQGFCESEKRALSQPIREKLFQYKHINPKQIQKYANQLVKEINQLDQDIIRIEASEVGAFICLAAMFSGKLSKQKDIYFELSSFPVKLFPRELVKKTSEGHAHHINICLNEDCWLKPFQTLRECPEYMELSGPIEEDTSFMGLAA
ncbi:hypothetical protein HBN50_00530 [Halobacteriovorax sp. GB3]|nr:hypothetical protein [Halobacteriovorax sp. GB3]